jgi:ParB family chromosome partitioning protein
MMEMRRQILDYGLNVRDVEKRAKRKRGIKKKPVSDLFIREIAERLKKHLSTKVTLKPNSKGGGVISIEYYSSDDLDRILDLIG